MAGRPIVPFLEGDVLRLRKAHACGTDTWQVDRLGADIGLCCQGCGRRVLLGRRDLEHRLAGFVSRGEPSTPAAPTAQAGG